MKKYKLLKDLPFAKAGEVFSYNPAKDSLVGVFGEVAIVEDIRDYHDWFEEIKEPKNLTINDVDWSFEPKLGEGYFTINFMNVVKYETRTLERAVDFQVFKTKEEAEAVARWNEALKTVRQSSDFKPDWNDNSPKYFVVYNYEYDCLSFDRCCNIPKTILPHYSSMNEAKEAAKKYEKEYKILFGVE